MSILITGASQGGVISGASASAGAEVVDIFGGTLSILSTGAAQGGVGDGASALAGPKLGLDNEKQQSFDKTRSSLRKK